MEIGVEINKPISRVINFLSQQKNMPLWTSHQSLIKTKAGFIEIRLHYRFTLAIQANKKDELNYEIMYQWLHENHGYQVCLFDKKITRKKIYVCANIMDSTFIPVFSAELRVLKSILENINYKEKDKDYFIINRHHIRIYNAILGN